MGLSIGAEAKNHTWKFNEFYSNADGSVQFIELLESEGSDEETQLVFAEISTVLEPPKVYTFPTNLQGPTGNRSLLLANVGYTNVPGLPAPDYVLPDGFFDPAIGETFRYRMVLDMVSFEPGQIPTDGSLSIDRTGIVGVNSPTNFAGESGSIIPTQRVPSLGLVFFLLLVGLLLAAGRWSLKQLGQRS